MARGKVASSEISFAERVAARVGDAGRERGGLPPRHLRRQGDRREPDGAGRARRAAARADVRRASGKERRGRRDVLGQARQGRGDGRHQRRRADGDGRRDRRCASFPPRRRPPPSPRPTETKVESAAAAATRPTSAPAAEGRRLPGSGERDGRPGRAPTSWSATSKGSATAPSSPRRASPTRRLYRVRVGGFAIGGRCEASRSRGCASRATRMHSSAAEVSER